MQYPHRFCRTNTPKTHEKILKLTTSRHRPLAGRTGGEMPKIHLDCGGW